ncbi:hypothetical protein CDAR_587501 [Caerostris darwini]|uniref:Uncharacterized protein n=1 Tax=Caerostris darwini TaxID=1538125 RepID=A0AAV4SN77_9ARAC|nr:hypothetical protein CDAR_587501 [Caerostris darwini]
MDPISYWHGYPRCPNINQGKRNHLPSKLQTKSKEHISLLTSLIIYLKYRHSLKICKPFARTFLTPALFLINKKNTTEYLPRINPTGLYLMKLVITFIHQDGLKGPLLLNTFRISLPVFKAMQDCDEKACTILEHYGVLNFN